MTVLRDVAGDPLLTAGDRTWRWGDLFLGARLWGEWEPWKASLAARVAPEDPRAAEVAFRRERRLIAADELRAWLDSHRLTVTEWRAWIRAEDGRSLWTEGVCSGAFDGWIDALAERAAALAASDSEPTPSPPPGDWFARMPAAPEADDLGIAYEEVPRRAEVLWQAERARERLQLDAASGDAIARTVAAHNADWLRVDCDMVEAGDINVAREAALLVREDGMALPDVAQVAGLAVATQRVYVGELPADLRPRLVSAARGELVGPVAMNGGDRFVLAHVHDKVVASAGDPEIRDRAEAAAVRAALDRAVREQVSWHGRE